MYEAAKAVLRPRRVSDFVDCGGVAAAICSASGNIYTGVCVDTCCTLGICAERNAIFHMLTEGEQEISKVLCLMGNGKTGAPCGACRELMVQLMAGGYREIEIMMDYETGQIVKLGELTPEWWIK
jgi:cytidine deaminase